MHHYIVFSIRSRPVNVALLSCCTPASADTAGRSFAHGVLTTRSGNVNDVLHCAALGESSCIKITLSFTNLWLVLLIGRFFAVVCLPVCQGKSCTCRLYFLPGVAGSSWLHCTKHVTEKHLEEASPHLYIKKCSVI